MFSHVHIRCGLTLSNGTATQLSVKNQSPAYSFITQVMASGQGTYYHGMYNLSGIVSYFMSCEKDSIYTVNDGILLDVIGW